MMIGRRLDVEGDDSSLYREKFYLLLLLISQMIDLGVESAHAALSRQ
jgi:hypothetical protein